MELLAALLAGLLAGLVVRLPARWNGWLNAVIFGSLALLIMALGAQIGADPEVLGNLGSLGLQALLLTLLSIGGSVLVVWLLERSWLNKFRGGKEAAGTSGENPFRLALWIGGLLLAGVAAGYFLLKPQHLALLSQTATAALCVFLFAVGVDLARQTGLLRQLAELGWLIGLIPLGVLLGGVLGALVGSFFLDLPLPVVLATGASSGFYSYAGVFLAEKAGAQAGTIAFLTNFFRELLSFFIIPVLGVKLKGSVAVIAPGGATTMDTTLPVITRTLGSGAAPIALINGVIVSLLVPLVVPLLLQL